MLTSPLTHAIAPPLRAPLASPQQPLTRVFHKLNPSASQHYRLGHCRLGNHYEIEITWATTNTRNQVLLGDSHLETYYLNMSTSIAWWSGGTAYVFNIGPIDIHDGKLHTLRILSTATHLRMKLDNTELSRANSAAWTPYQGDVTDLLIGSSNSNPVMFDGCIASLKIWTNGDHDHGELTEFLFNTTLASPYIANTQAQYSNDLFHPSHLDLQASWSGDHRALSFDNSANGYAFAPDICGQGYYRVQYTISGHCTDLRMFIGGLWTTVSGQPGTHTLLLRSDNDTDYFRLYATAGAGQVTISRLSVQPLQHGHTITAINMTSDEAQLYQWDTNSSAWIGPDLLTNGDFQTKQGWFPGDQFHYDPNSQSYYCNNAQGTNGTSRALYRVQERPYKYRIITDLELTQGSVEFYDGADYNHIITPAGPTSLDIINQSLPYWYFTLRLERGTTARFHRFQMREILELAT